MDTLSMLAPAKINLALRILPLREDGFHGVDSLVATVDLCDELRVRPRDDDLCTMACDDPSLPTDASNLVLRAAAALAQATGAARGAHFELRKRIPAGAGLGGGSSDAAAALWLLNALWGAGLDSAQLLRIGAQVGSDVPLFLTGAACRVQGRGERVERLACTLAGCAVLILPPLHCATRAVYSAWDALGGAQARGSIDELVEQLGAGATLASLSPRLFNDLEPAAVHVEPRLGALLLEARRALGAPIHVTGSGAGMFSLHDDQVAAECAAERLRGALDPAIRVLCARLGRETV